MHSAGQTQLIVMYISITLTWFCLYLDPALPVYHQYTLRVLHGQRDELVETLRANEIGFGIFYPLTIHEQRCYQIMSFSGNWSIADKIKNKVFHPCPPPGLSHTDLKPSWTSSTALKTAGKSWQIPLILILTHVSEKAKIGKNTKIWINTQIRENAEIGDNCVISKDVYIDHAVKIGNGVKIQNGVSVFHGVTIKMASSSVRTSLLRMITSRAPSTRTGMFPRHW